MGLIVSAVILFTKTYQSFLYLKQWCFNVYGDCKRKATAIILLSTLHAIKASKSITETAQSCFGYVNVKLVKQTMSDFRNLC